MVRRRFWMAVAAGGSCLVIVGCGSSAAPGTRAANTLPSASSGAWPANRPGTVSITGPSISAQEICSEDEVQNAIALTLGLRGRPQRSSRWVKPVYTCIYRLDEGPLRLTVTEFGSDAAALNEFKALRSQYALEKVPTQTLESFEVPAFFASDDVVLTVKDNKLLRVDAGSLPKTLGPAHRARRDLSYLVVSAILRCWSGD